MIQFSHKKVSSKFKAYFPGYSPFPETLFPESAKMLKYQIYAIPDRRLLTHFSIL